MVAVLIVNTCGFTRIMSSTSSSFREAYGVANVLKATARLLFKHWTLILKIFFGIMLPFVLLGGGFVGMGTYWMEGAIEWSGSVAFTTMAWLSVLAGVLILVTGSGLSGAGMLAVVRLEQEHGDADFSGVWRLAKAHAFSIIGVGVLYGVTLLVGGGVLFGILSGLDLSNVARLGIGGILCFLGAAYLLFRGFILAYAVAVVENRAPISAISRAFALTKNAFWQTTGIFVVVGIVYGVGSRMLQAMVGQLVDVQGGGIGMAVGSGSMFVGVFAVLIGFMVTNSLLASLSSLAAMVQTYALKGREDRMEETKAA